MTTFADKFIPDDLPDLTEKKEASMRDKLDLRKYAEKLGYTVTGNDRPGDPVYFKKGNRHIWYCCKGWACADVVGKHHEKHRYYPTLKEALDKEASPEMRLMKVFDWLQQVPLRMVPT